MFLADSLDVPSGVLDFLAERLGSADPVVCEGVHRAGEDPVRVHAPSVGGTSSDRAHYAPRMFTPPSPAFGTQQPVGSPVTFLVALAVILLDLLLVPGALAVVSDVITAEVPEQTAENWFHLAAWAVAGVPFIAAFACAVRVMRETEYRRRRRLATWASGLYFTGMAALVAAVVVRNALLFPS